MKHLLPYGAKAPIRARYYEGDQDLKDRSIYEELYSKILSVQKEHGDTVSQQEQAAWWGHAMYSQNPGNLWHTLSRDFFFDIPGKILNADFSKDLVEIADDGTPYLTTAKLNSCLQDWKIRIEEMDHEEQAARLLVAKVVLSQSATILRHLSRVLFLTGTPESAGDDPTFLTHSACVLIHQAMVEASGAVLGLEVRAGNEYSLRGCLPLVYYSLQKENWCPSTVWQLNTLSDVDEMAYAYWLGSVRAAKNHGGCTEFACEANQMSEGETPGHVLNSDCSECTIVSVPIHDVLDIINTGAIPILRITKDDGFSCSLTVTAMNDESCYIAISHVWTDGLGSSISNSISMCRLQELSRHIEQLEREFHLDGLCFWADTLCVPMNPAYIDAREMQIRRMHEVYSLAWAVVIIDADFMSMKMTADVKVIGTRLRLSAWASRLWTYQEGAFNARLFLMAEDGLVDVTIQNPWSTDENEMVFNETELNLRRRCDRVAQMLLYSINARTTSRPDDEALVIASSLDLDTPSITTATAEDRMMALIKTLPIPYPPANMIFTVGARLSSSGFRWAPKTFLRSKGGGCFTSPLAELVPFTMKQIDKHEVGARRMCRLDASGRGLRTFNPAVLLPGICFQEMDEAENDLCFEIMGKPYAIRGCADDIGDLEACRRASGRIRRLLAERKRLVVLLAEFYPSDRHYTGVLVDVTSESLPGTSSDVDDDGTETVGEFVMLVQFVNKIPKAAVKEMGLAAADEVDAFVTAARQLEIDRARPKMREEAGKQGQNAKAMLVIRGGSVSEEDGGLVNSGESHNTRSSVEEQRLDEHLRTDQETEKYLSKVVEAFITPGPQKRKSTHSAAWLEPRFWLVD